MRIVLDGRTYDVDLGPLADLYAAKTREYLDPQGATPVLKPAERLALKALLRPRQTAILQAFAHLLCVDDWQSLKPGKGDDLLLILHDYVVQVLRAELANISVTLDPVGDSDESLFESDTGARRAVTGAALGPLAVRFEQGRDFPESSGPIALTSGETA